MTLLLDHPAWALLAGLLAAASTAALVMARRSSPHRRAALALPLLAATCVAFALAGPHLSAHARADAPVVILLDLSPSTRGAPWRDPAWVQRLAGQRLGPARPVTLVGFDTRPRFLMHTTPAGPWPSEWVPDPPGTATAHPLEAALAWRSPQESAGAPPGPRWLITDALVPAPKSPPTFPLACTFIPPTPLDLAVTDLQLRPSRTERRLELLVQVRAAGAAATDVRTSLQVYRDGKLLTQQPLSFTPTAGALNASRWISVIDTPPRSSSFSDADRHSPHAYEVLITSTDPWPENNRAGLLWSGHPGRRVLIVGKPLAGLDAPAVPASQFAAGADELAAAGWQTVLLNDIGAVPRESASADTLGPAAAAALDRFVRDTGGGLLLLGREQAFGPGGYASAAPTAATLDALSPVWSRPHTGDDRHLVLLLDASASMNGSMDTAAGNEQKFRLLARGVSEAAALLAADDRLTAITFNTSAQLLADGPRDSTAAALQEALARVAPQGGTHPDAALPVLQAALAAGVQDPLVVLVTDGDIPTLDVDRWRSVLQRPGKSPAALAIIAPRTPGEGGAGGADTALHQLAATPGTTWSPSSDPSTWSALLQQLVRARVTGRVRRESLAWKTVAPEGAPLTGAAPLWIETWLKPEATLLAEGRTTPADAPFPAAAIVQRGLGKVAALSVASAAPGDPAHRALLTDILARITPPAGDRRFTLAARKADDGTWQLTADAAGDSGFLNNAALAARVLAPALSDALTLPFQQTAPGHYEATVRHPAPFHATITRDGPALVGHVAAPSLETTEWPATVARPLAPADLAATPLSPDVHDLTQWAPPLTATTPIAPAFWLAGALAALASLYLRR